MTTEPSSVALRHHPRNETAVNHHTDTPITERASTSQVQPPVVEVAVDGPAGARAAQVGGAQRVELAAALSAAGGLSPTAALVGATAAVGLDVHALIRCRPGGFIYTPEEIDVMAAEITDCARAGASGVVIGAATAGGALDVPALSALLSVATDCGLFVTLHRVIDTFATEQARLEAIDICAELGVGRILTSAGAPTATENPEGLARMVAAARPHGIEIMAGGGVSPQAAPALRAIGLAAVHASCSSPSTATGPVGPGGGAATIKVTDAAIVRALVEAIHPTP